MAADRFGWKVCIAVASIALAACSEISTSVERVSSVAPRFQPANETASAGEVASSETPGLEDDALTPVQEATETVIGTGNFVNRNRPTPQIAADGAGNVGLNFIDVPVRDVVESVVGETLGLNYAIDPAVQGQVTLRTSQPLSRAALLPTLESVLRLNGIAILEQDGLMRIVPEASALTGGVVPRVGRSPGTSAFGVQVVPLKHVSAPEMAAVLDPLSRPGTVLRIDAARNLLMIQGTRQERRNLLEVVEIFDVDLLAGRSFSLVPLEVATPADVVRDLGKVFGQDADGPLAGIVDFISIERTNSVLVVSSNPQYIDDAQQWIERFDAGGETGDRRLFVYHVQNGRAADLAGTLSQIFSSERTRFTAEPVGVIRPGLVPAEISSDTIIFPAAGPDEPRDTTISGEVATGLAPEVQQTPTTQQRTTGSSSIATTGLGINASGEGDIRIIADEVNNALLILATTRQFRQLRTTLRELDIVPLQVLIEATIAEVTLQNELRYGLQWFFQAGDSSVTFSADQSGAVASEFPGFSYLLSAGPDVRVVLNALEDVTDINVISAPQLMVLDNRTAELQVGDQVPVATRSAVSTVDPDSPVVNSIEFRDTGVVLRVTPRVNASGLVNLDIEQEVSDVVETTTSGIDSPTIQQRRVSSSVVVQNGETIALGGLIRDNRTQGSVGIPGLARIPVVGFLFGTKSTDAKRTELLIMITPRVIRDQAEASAVTEELRRKVQAVIPLYDGRNRKPPG